MTDETADDLDSLGRLDADLRAANALEPTGDGGVGCCLLWFALCVLALAAYGAVRLVDDFWRPM